MELDSINVPTNPSTSQLLEQGIKLELKYEDSQTEPKQEICIAEASNEFSSIKQEEITMKDDQKSGTDIKEEKFVEVISSGFSLIKHEEIMIEDDEENGTSSNPTVLKSRRCECRTSSQSESTGYTLQCINCNYESDGQSSCKFFPSQLGNSEKIEGNNYSQGECGTIRTSGLVRNNIYHEKTDEAIMYKCDQCDYQTIWKHNLAEHFLIHKRPREAVRYKCDQCDYQAIRKDHLKMHSNIKKLFENPL